MIRVVVDSTADIPQELREQLDIAVVPLTVQFGEESLRDGVDISAAQFYQRLQRDPQHPKTSQPAPGAFLSVYEQLLHEAEGVVSIHISGKLSGTLQSAEQAARQLDGAALRLVDTGSTALTQGLIAIAAAEAARAGASLAEVEALARELAGRGFLYAGLDTLKYLERGGRIGKMRAFLGTLLSVKPILEVRGGEVLPVEQVRTAKRLPQRLMELASRHAPIERLAVLYTDPPGPAEQLARLCAEAGLLPAEKILLAQMGPVIGTHAGPAAVGIAGISAAR
jgi:DegV family protein with EDD domain